ncbi:MAG: 30S ribosomal protein S5, partial [Candidatus Omnitrophica bacterium]|nr:30S ribosomal protein S5 [Candidatus Omnitrophota bacterium]
MPKEEKTVKPVRKNDKNVDSTKNNTQNKRADVLTKNSDIDATNPDTVEHVIKINRVSKVVKGGKNFSFSALVVTGDGKGSVGMGFGKSNEVVEAIKKGTAQAKKNFKKVSMQGDTIPHEVTGRFKASYVLLKPAGPGTGVIAGGPVRALCDAAGIKNILTK